MTARDKLIATARAEIGYLEKKSDANLYDKTANAGQNNYTKYWADMTPSFQTEPWCDCFVGWCFKKTFGEKLGNELLCGGMYSYSTPPSAECFKAKGQYFKIPRPGDVVYFNVGRIIGHTGIVAWVNGDRFGTIEGNTPGASGVIQNGGGVCEKSYCYINNSYVNGFGRPDWTLAEEEDFLMSYEKFVEYQKKYEEERAKMGVSSGWQTEAKNFVTSFTPKISDGNSPQCPAPRVQIWAMLRVFHDTIIKEVKELIKEANK